MRDKIMGKHSGQTQAWGTEFGIEYTERNLMTTRAMDSMYLKQYGISRTDMNIKFLGGLDRDIKILEVGSNIGLQLMFLQKMGFKNLYGIEISSYAAELSKSKTKDINIIQGIAQDIPFRNNYFDMVFTSGVLIHINPVELPKVLSEIYRCSRQYIWGLEYYAKNYTQIKYRVAKETSDLLWKANFPQIFMEQFDDLEIVKLKSFKYLDSENEDVMYLFKKHKQAQELNYNWVTYQPE